MKRAMLGVHSKLATGLTLLLLTVAPGLYAQSYDNPSLGSQPVVAHPQDFKPLGIRAGSFMLHPGVELAGEWTDNVFFSYDNEESDFIYHIRPYITAQSNWSRHSFTVRVAADIARHSDFGFRDYEDYFLNITGRLDVKDRSALNYNLDYLRLHEGLNNRSAQQGVKPTKYSLTGAGVSFDHQFNRVGLNLSYDYADLDFDNNIGFDGEIIDNQDRDRNNQILGMRLGYQFKSDMQAFLGGSWRKVDYDQEFDRNGFNRSSDGYSLNAGVRTSITGVLSGDFSINYHDMSYDDPRLRNVSGWAFGAGLTWYPTLLTTVRASISSGVHQTTNANASGYLGTLYTLRVDHELTRDIQINGQVSYRDNDYELIAGAPENARDYDRVWRVGVGGTYFINRSVYLSASYDYSKLSSNIERDGFKVNRVWLVLGLEK